MAVVDKIHLSRFTQYAFGKQTDFDTPVAATRRATFNDTTLTQVLEREMFDGLRGIPTAEPTAFRPIVTSSRASLPLPGPMNMRDILRPLLAGIDASPVIADPGAAASGRRTVTFQPDAQEVPLPSVFTLERTSQNAAETPNAWGHRYPKCYLTSFALAEGGNGMVNLTEQWMLGAEEEHVFTSGLDAPVSPVAVGITRFWTTSFHPNWMDAISNTGALAGSRSFNNSINFTTGWVPTMEREGAMDYDEIGFAGSRPLTISGSMYLREDSDFAQSEQERLEEFRYIRCHIESPIEIESGHRYSLTIIAAVTHQDGSMRTRGEVAGGAGGAGGMSTLSFAVRSAGVGDNGIYIQALVADDDVTGWGLTA